MAERFQGFHTNLTYQNARKLCSGCQFAEVNDAPEGNDKFEVGCFAPVVSVVTPYEKRRFNEDESSLPPDVVSVEVKFTNQPGALCTFMPRPNDNGCPRAKAGANTWVIEGKYQLTQDELPTRHEVFRVLQAK